MPEQKASAFRESLQVVFASIICLSITSGLFAALRWALPSRTLDFRGLVRDPGRFARDHHVQLIWWSLAFLGISIVLACVASDRRVIHGFRALGQMRPLKWLLNSSEADIRRESAWHYLMHLRERDEAGPGPIRVGVALDDGSYVEGNAHNFNTAFEETGDRDFVLSAPITLVRANGRQRKLDWLFTVVSARRIVRMDVTHLDPDVTLDESQAPG